MSRFYYRFDEDSEEHEIYDRSWSNVTPIAWCEDVNVAEMLVSALNAFWSKPQ
jgi:hypothetical protein